MAGTGSDSRCDPASEQRAADSPQCLRRLARRPRRGARCVSISYDVRIWAIRVRKDRGKPYQVRWKVGNAPPTAKSFRTRGLADSFRSGLIQATRRGEGFDTGTGLPGSELQARESITWYEHALDYIDMKWPQAAGKSRISAVETLTAVTPVLIRPDQGMPDPAILRAALRRWAFNPVHRNDPKPADARAALAWIRRMSLPISALLDDKVHPSGTRLARGQARWHACGSGLPRSPPTSAIQRPEIRGPREAATRRTRLTRPTGSRPIPL